MNTAPVRSPAPMARASNLRCLYLDTSFFINLEKNFSVRSAVAKKLSRLVETLPLCMSFMTILELARGRQTPQLDAMAEFVDSLVPFWFRPEDELARAEVRAFLKTNGQGPFGAFDPFDKSIYSAFRHQLRHTEHVDLISGSATFASFLRQIQGSTPGQQTLERLTTTCAPMLSKLRDDRKSPHPFQSNKHAGRAHTDKKVLWHIQALLAEETVAMATEGAPDIKLIQHQGLYLPSSPAATNLSQGDIPKFPSIYLMHEFTHLRANAYQGMSQRKFDACTGDVGDYLHIAAGAYSEFFQCDGPSSQAILRGRAAIGLPPPLVMRNGDPLKLLVEIERQLEHP